MSVLPGQRVIVMMSPGFYLLPSMHQPAVEVVDRATKENVVINAIDARGLYVSSVYDASNAPTTASVNPLKTISTMREEETHFTPLAELADGTGGTFFTTEMTLIKVSCKLRESRKCLMSSALRRKI